MSTSDLEVKDSLSRFGYVRRIGHFKFPLLKKCKTRVLRFLVEMDQKRML